MKNFKFEDKNFLKFVQKSRNFHFSEQYKDKITYQFNYLLYNSITNLYVNSGKKIHFVNFSQISNITFWIILQIFFESLLIVTSHQLSARKKSKISGRLPRFGARFFEREN